MSSGNLKRVTWLSKTQELWRTWERFFEEMTWMLSREKRASVWRWGRDSWCKGPKAARSWMKDFERERSVSRSRAGEDSTEAETDLSTGQFGIYCKRVVGSQGRFYFWNVCLFIWLCLVLVVASGSLLHRAGSFIAVPGLCSWGAWAQLWRCMGLDAPQHMGS